MPQIARINDSFSGVCCHPAHSGCIFMTGFIEEGNANHVSGGSPVSYLGALVRGFCGHIGYITSASSKVTTNNIQVAYLGSAVGGPYLFGQIVSGDTNNTVGI